MGKLSLGLGLGVGYVLGAQAGRARYEQIKRAAAGVMERPEVQQAMERARSAAPAPLQGSLDKLTGRGSGGQGAGTGTSDAATPPLPVSDSGDAARAESSLPDPLLPPARSVDDPGRP
jgi:hypothetical protein